MEAKLFIAALLRAQHLSLFSDVNPVHDPQHNSSKFFSNVVLSSTPSFPNDLSPSVLPSNPMYGTLLSAKHATRLAYLIFLDFFTPINLLRCAAQ